MSSTVLHHTALYCAALFSTVLCCDASTALCCAVLYCTPLQSTVQYCAALYCSVVLCMLWHSGRSQSSSQYIATVVTCQVIPAHVVRSH
jgi:hypothetical protein